MKKKPPVLSFPKTKAVVQSNRFWHNGGDIEIALYARSLHRAAKTLVETLDLQPNPKTRDACPVVLLYRQSVELHLKALVDEGCNFLPSPTDPISLYKTHSLRWLAQIVCQIVKTVQLENEFKIEGIATFPTSAPSGPQIEGSEGFSVIAFAPSVVILALFSLRIADGGGWLNVTGARHAGAPIE
jgi:hypothetical protein